jgi:hypothetical protein
MAAITSIMGAVEKVVGVGRDLAPEREAGGTNWAPVVDRTVDAIKLLVEENRAQRGAPALGPGTPDAPVATFPEGTPMWQVEIAQWIPKLLVRAEGDKDAQLAATVFLEDVTPATGRAVVEQALGATFVADTLKQLALIEPRTTQHAEWFTDFLTQIQDYAKDAAAQGTGSGTPAVKLEP